MEKGLGSGTPLKVCFKEENIKKGDTLPGRNKELFRDHQDT